MMDDLVFKAGGWLGLALLALIFAALAVDTPFAVHMIIVAITCLIVLWTRISRADYAGMARGLLKIPPDEGVYDDDPVRWGVIATIFWGVAGLAVRSEEHTSELQSLMRISYAVFCLKKKKQSSNKHNTTQQ